MAVETNECPDGSIDCRLPTFKMDCSTGKFDIEVANCDTSVDAQIQSAIIIALCAKARVASHNGPCRGGWWADQFNSNPIGTTLWSLEGNAVNADTLRAVEQGLEDALQHLVENGTIQSVTVNASTDGSIINIDDILIRRPEGQTNYSYLWDIGVA